MVSTEPKQTPGDVLQTIPTISLAELQRGRTQALSVLADACEQWGFFKLIDHGIKPQTREMFLTCMHAYFDQPAEVKKQCERSDKNPWGYYDRELTKNQRDWKEIFDLGVDQDDGKYSSHTPWPETPDNFRDIMLGWHARCEVIGVDLVRAICSSLGLEEEQLTSAFRPVNSSFLRLNYYPVCEDPADASLDFPTDGHLGISHHTDAGAVTVLLQGDVDGLQVRHEGSWTTVRSDPEALIINIGDMIQVWSNDRYKAPLHRVRANSSKERYSAAFFLNPAFRTNVEPLGQGSARYTPINWGEFRAGRAAGDYANIGEEIQISDFRL